MGLSTRAQVTWSLFMGEAMRGNGWLRFLGFCGRRRRLEAGGLRAREVVLRIWRERVKMMLASFIVGRPLAMVTEDCWRVFQMESSEDAAQ